MINFIQPGNAITLDAPRDVLSGEGILVGDLFGVAAGTALTGVPVTIETVGVYALPKAGDALAVGNPIHWDDAARVVTADAAAGVNRAIGHAVAIAASGAATVAVRLSV